MNTERIRRYLQEPISHLELSVRGSNALEEAGIKTIGELVSKSEADLLEHECLGYTTLSEIKESLSSMGLTLGAKGK
jgi:DNA-directed RNA polymerase subunit alpha